MVSDINLTHLNFKTLYKLSLIHIGANEAIYLLVNELKHRETRIDGLKAENTRGTQNPTPSKTALDDCALRCACVWERQRDVTDVRKGREQLMPSGALTFVTTCLAQVGSEIPPSGPLFCQKFEQWFPPRKGFAIRPKPHIILGTVRDLSKGLIRRNPL